ncbi:hypothetical protein CDES_10205 [Corynebacterium deserti GIMN1.010]|uniref:Acyl carrier protein n=1 Tax=Corynebacterium deserti GIMN1.010 TaxID=931089 RepID=A0A0M4CMT5_9CORY|nr:acyl carrier protein [Corynebacterium deserti]ALC06422.1 hypothetical protein CDES_10205 [Corynebacterium deserti GIMN1.010]
MQLNDLKSGFNGDNTPDENLSVFASLAQILQDIGGISKETISPESRFLDDLAVSSLNFIELIVTVEDTFGVRIEDTEAQDFKTVQDVVDFINTNKES